MHVLARARATLVDKLLLRRALAFLFDRAIAIGFAAGGAMEHAFLRRAGLPRVAFAAVLLGALAATAYAYLRDAIRGQSIGKYVFGLRVVERDTGKPIGPLRALMRDMPLHITPIALIEATVFFFRSGARLGDAWAKTRVVDVRTP